MIVSKYSASKNDMGLDVHWAFQKIYDYFSTNHANSSYDNSNHAINAYFRFGVNWENAAWDPSAQALYFGQANTTFRPMASLDVIAHEYGHAISTSQIGWGATLIEAAFHEGMSDIWGVVLEQRIRNNSPWRIGEQVTLTKSFIRNLQNTNDGNAY